MDLRELTSEIRLLTQQFTGLKKQLENVTDSLALCHQRLDDLGTTMAASEARLKVLEDQNAEVPTLRYTVHQLKTELNMQAQNMLNNEIELIGIPECPSENLHHTILITAGKIGMDLNENDIDWVSRVGRRPSKLTQPQLPESASTLPRPVVIRFVRRAKRNDMLAKSKVRRNITSADIDVPGPPQKIYFNERLTKENRQLFRDARISKKQKGYSNCWYSRGTVYIRTRDGQPGIPIRSLDDLHNIPDENIRILSNS